MANVHRYKADIIKLTEIWHRTAEQVFKELKKSYFFIGIGSVYRNLTELTNEWILMKHHGMGDKVIYEKNKPHHGHLFCQNTGMIEDIDISHLPLENISIPENFCLDEVEVTITWHFKDSNSAYCKINGKLLR